MAVLIALLPGIIKRRRPRTFSKDEPIVLLWLCGEQRMPWARPESSCRNRISFRTSSGMNEGRRRKLTPADYTTFIGSRFMTLFTRTHNFAYKSPGGMRELDS